MQPWLFRRQRVEEKPPRSQEQSPANDNDLEKIKIPG